MKTSLNIGQAVEALKAGERVARDHSDWVLNKSFIFMQVPSIIGKEIVPKMQSLPQSVKDEFQKRFESETEQVDSIYYKNQIAIVYSSNLICGWCPSIYDLLATDWYVLD
jgi:hypothetical protein